MNYSDNTKPQITARYFGIRRSGKSIASWTVDCLEREYVNVTQDDADFYKDLSGFNFTPDMTEEFPIFDPITLEPTEAKVSYAQLFGMIQSAYLHEAYKRDPTKNYPLPVPVDPNAPPPAGHAE
jgi:hypothetical protein